MESGVKLKPWGNLSTSLVVLGQDMNAATLLDALHIVEGEDFPSSGGVGIYSGPGWATLTVDERRSDSADDQALELIGLLSPRKPELDALTAAGNLVKVDLAGVAEESRTGVFVSPGVLAGLAELGVPVTFTALRASGEDEEDPLAWLG